jgi:hypothetical protein
MKLILKNLVCGTRKQRFFWSFTHSFFFHGMRLLTQEILLTQIFKSYLGMKQHLGITSQQFSDPEKLIQKTLMITEDGLEKALTRSLQI